MWSQGTWPGAEVLILFSVTMTTTGTTCLEMTEHHRFQTAKTSEPSVQGLWARLGMVDLNHSLWGCDPASGSSNTA